MPDEGISARAEGLEHSPRVEEHILKVARSEDVRMQLPDLIPKTHKALVMGELARDMGIHERVHKAIFAAYFGDGEDIGSEQTLLRVAEAEGMDPGELVSAWADGRYEDRLHSFYHLALGLGVNSTPSALICNELVVGTRPYAVIRESVDRCLLTEANIEERAEQMSEALES